MTWRVGLLIPSPNSVMEVDFYRSLPHDTTLHTARMYMPDMTVASEERMLDQFMHAGGQDGGHGGAAHRGLRLARAPDCCAARTTTARSASASAR